MHTFDSTPRAADGVTRRAADDNGTAPPSPYGRNAVGAYALGLGAAFFANEYVRRGQPALLYRIAVSTREPGALPGQPEARCMHARHADERVALTALRPRLLARSRLQLSPRSF